jgi:hypothetical protein
MGHTYTDGTERIGDLIVQVFADDSGASNPREFDNLAAIHGTHDRYEIGDGKPPAEHMQALERGGLRLLNRYMRRFGDPASDGSAVLAFRGLAMYDHSGITFWTVNPGESGHHAFDSAGWDSGLVGYAYATKARADELGADVADVAEQLEGEVKEYDDWAKGNVWAYRVVKPCDHADEHDSDEEIADCPHSDEEIADCPHSDEVDSCYGFIGEPSYAWEEARAAAKAELVPS